MTGPLCPAKAIFRGEEENRKERELEKKRKRDCKLVLAMSPELAFYYTVSLSSLSPYLLLILTYGRKEGHASIMLLEQRVRKGERERKRSSSLDFCARGQKGAQKKEREREREREEERERERTKAHMLGIP